MVKLVVEKEYIRHNAETLLSMAPDTTLIGVVKANGYGFGVVELSRELIACGVTMLAVADIEDGLRLRSAGTTAPILMLSPLSDGEELRSALNNNITLCIASYDGALRAEKAASELGVRGCAHLKTDTGFGRFGFMPDKPDEIERAVSSMKSIAVTGIFTHLYDTFGKNEKNTRKQFDTFVALCDTLKARGIDVGMRHIANSCGFLRFPYTRLEAARIGSAFLGRVAIENKYGLKRAGRVFARIEEIRSLPKGHNVAYYSGFKTKRDTRTAVIYTGYSCGFGIEYADDALTIKDSLRYIWRDVRGITGKRRPYVYVGGKRCAVLGMTGVCTAVIDVTDVACEIGDEAEIPMKTLLLDSSVKKEYV